MFFDVSRQPAAEPPKLKTIAGVTQILRGLLRRHSEKIHFIQRGNDGRPVASKFAMEIDGMITFISQDGQYPIDMLFRW